MLVDKRADEWVVGLVAWTAVEKAVQLAARSDGQLIEKLDTLMVAMRVACWGLKSAGQKVASKADMSAEYLGGKTAVRWVAKKGEL
jgi:hypothetical protein